MRKDKKQVIGDEISDDYIKSFLQFEPADGVTSPSHHKLVRRTAGCVSTISSALSASLSKLAWTWMARTSTARPSSSKLPTSAMRLSTSRSSTTPAVDIQPVLDLSRACPLPQG